MFFYSVPVFILIIDPVVLAINHLLTVSQYNY